MRINASFNGHAVVQDSELTGLSRACDWDEVALKCDVRLAVITERLIQSQNNFTQFVAKFAVRKHSVWRLIQGQFIAMQSSNRSRFVQFSWQLHLAQVRPISSKFCL